MGLDPWVVLGLFVLLAYTTEAVTGFGSIVIALALGALLLPIPEMLPVLVPLNVVMTGYLCAQHWRDVDTNLLGRFILPWMGAGTLIGYLLIPWLGHSLLKLLLGGLILWFSARQLRLLLQHRTPESHTPVTSRALTLGAGLTHGLFASGGPMLVSAMTGIPLPREVFRATLLSVWLVLNTGLSLLFLVDGSLQNGADRLVWFIPLVVLGAWVGNHLQPYLNERLFRMMVFSVLAVTGVILMAGSIY